MASRMRSAVVGLPLRRGSAAAGFFRGRRRAIGFGFGGTYGKYTRMFAEHLKNHIPGKPNIIVESRPGAGGLKATNYAAKAMPANGLNYLVPPDSSVVVQLGHSSAAGNDRDEMEARMAGMQQEVLAAQRQKRRQRIQELTVNALGLLANDESQVRQCVAHLNSLLPEGMRLLSSYR